MIRPSRFWLDAETVNDIPVRMQNNRINGNPNSDTFVSNNPLEEIYGIVIVIGHVIVVLNNAGYEVEILKRNACGHGFGRCFRFGQ